MASLDWVCRNFSYRSDDGEMWRFPAETIRLGYGDCDDTAIHVVAITENFTNAYVAAGSYKGYGHAWGQLNGTILESTYASARLVPDPQDYIPYVLFNDKEVIELWPGALRQLFQLNRNERLKLDQMAETLEQDYSMPIALALLLGVVGSIIGGLTVTALVGVKS